MSSVTNKATYLLHSHPQNIYVYNNLPLNVLYLSLEVNPKPSHCMTYYN